MHLCDNFSILHRDISPNNLMLYMLEPNSSSELASSEAGSSPYTRHRGLVIDYDYAMMLDKSDPNQDNQFIVGHCTVRQLRFV